MPEGTAQSTGEQVVQIPLDQLHPFPNHPFKVRNIATIIMVDSNLQRE